MIAKKVEIKKKSNLHYTRDIAPKRITSGGVRLRDLEPGQCIFEETLLRWRAVGDAVPDLPAGELNPRPPAPLAISLCTVATPASLFYYDAEN